VPPHHAAGGKNRAPAARHPAFPTTKPKPKATTPKNVFAVTPPLAPPDPSGFSARTPAGRAHALTVAAAQQKSRDDRMRAQIIAENNRKATLQTITNSMRASSGLPANMSKPFGPGSAPVSYKARDPYQPDLTAKTQLAAANALRRITPGGLLTPAQASAESVARIKVDNSKNPTFAQTHPLPWQLAHPELAVFMNQPPPAPASTRVHTGPTTLPAEAPKGSLPKPKTQAQVGRGVPGNDGGGGGSFPDIFGGLKSAASAVTHLPETVESAASSPFAHDLAGYLAATALSYRSIGAIGAPDPNALFTLIRNQKSLGKNVEGVNRRIGGAVDALRPSVGPVPHIEVSIDDLTPTAQAAVNQKRPSGPLYLDDVVKLVGQGGLNTAMRQQLVDLAKKNGWPTQDAHTWSDADLAARAFNKYTHSVAGFFQNAAADSAATAAAANIAPMLGIPLAQSISQHSLSPIAKVGGQFAQQWANHLLFLGDRPIQENFYNQPFTTFTSNAPFIKAVGVRAGRFLPESVSGTKLGSRLENSREITLPQTGEVIRVPATQNVLTRPFTKVTDYLLSHSAHPGDRGIDATGLKGELQGLLQGPRGAAGHFIERQHGKRFGERARLEATLEKSTEARLALNEYMAAIRGLPTKAKDVLPFSGTKTGSKETGDQVRQASKQTRAEAIVKHAGLGSSSHEVVAHYTEELRKTEAELAKQTSAHEKALERISELETEAEHGSDVADQLHVAHRTEEALRQNVEREKIVRDNQKQMIDYSANNPVDLANLTKEEKRLIVAAERVSKASTSLKVDAGKMGGIGALYGDFQHRVAIVHNTEGPGTRLGGAKGTEAWKIADSLLAHRGVVNDLEAQLKGEGVGLADRNAPAAKVELGKIRALSPVLKEIRQRRAAVAKRREARRKRLGLATGKPAPPATPAEIEVSSHAKIAEARAAAAAHEAANPGHTTRIVSEKVPGTPAKAPAKNWKVISTHESAPDAAAAAKNYAAAHPGYEVKPVKVKAGKKGNVITRGEGGAFPDKGWTTKLAAKRAGNKALAGHPIGSTAEVFETGRLADPYGYRITEPSVPGVHELRVRKAGKPAVKVSTKHTVHAQPPTPKVHAPRSGVPQRIANEAEAAAQSAGASKGTIRRILDESKSALTAKRERHARDVAAQRKLADEMEAEQRKSHEKVADARVAEAQRKVKEIEQKRLYLSRRVPSENTLEIAKANLKTAQDFREHGFELDDRAIKARAKQHSMEAAASEIELTPTETKEIAARHLKAAEAKAVGVVKLHDLITEALHEDASKHLDMLEKHVGKAHAEATKKYEDISGSKASAAERKAHEQDMFEQGLIAFAKNQHDLGRAPFHIVLHKPGDEANLTPVEKAFGGQFREGDYTADTHVYLAHDLDAHARDAVTREIFRKVSESPYVIENPKAFTPIEPGWQLVSLKSLDALRKPQFRASDENKQLIQEWIQKSGRHASGGHVPDEGGPYALISKDLADWISDELHLGVGKNFPGLNGALKFTNAYRRWMLFTLPRTLVNNAVGNPILAMMGGAGIMDYIRAIHVLRNHPEQIPITMRHRGPLANVLETQKIAGYQSFWRNANVFHEDLGRLTVFMHHVIREARNKQGLRFYQKIDMASEEMTTFLKDMANGKNPDIHRFTKFADDWFGNMSKRGKWDPILSTSFLFHRWVGHMVALTLWTMPLKYPGRTALLLNLSHMADDYRREHGIFPDWARNIVPFHSEFEKVAGMPQKVVWGLGTGGFMPFSTPAQTFDLGGVSNPKAPLLALAANNLNPFARILIEQGIGKRLDTLQDFKDSHGNAIGGLSPTLAWNQFGANTPILNTVFPRTGKSADYRQGLDDLLGNQKRAFSAAGARNPEYYPSNPYGHSIWRDALVRLLGASGLPVRPIDSTGPRTLLSSQKAVQAIYGQAQQKNQREALLAHAAESKRISSQARAPYKP
jgi:hypothetical protein